MLKGNTSAANKSNHRKNEQGASINFGNVANPTGPIPNKPAELGIKGLTKETAGGALYE